MKETIISGSPESPKKHQDTSVNFHPATFLFGTDPLTSFFFFLNKKASSFAIRKVLQVLWPSPRRSNRLIANTSESGENGLLESCRQLDKRVDLRLAQCKKWAGLREERGRRLRRWLTSRLNRTEGWVASALVRLCFWNESNSYFIKENVGQDCNFLPVKQGGGGGIWMPRREREREKLRKWGCRVAAGKLCFLPAPHNSTSVPGPKRLNYSFG